MHLLDVLYYVCVGFFLVHVGGQFSICTLDSYWCTHTNLAPLYGFTFVPFVLTFTVQSAWDHCDVMPVVTD